MGIVLALTDDHGNAMLQSFLSKVLKKAIGSRYSRTAAMGKTGEKCFSRIVHAAVRGETCAFALKIVNTLIHSSSRDGRPSIST